MAVLDSQGRLFGKVSILDLGAALVILMVVVGIFLIPGETGSVAQIGDGSTQQVEIDLIVRGLSVRDPQTVIGELNESKKTNLIVRKEPSGQVDVRSVRILEEMLAVPQPDGSVKALPDPRTEESYRSVNMAITLAGKAQKTDTGYVLGNSKLKIGTPVELEGITYNFNASVIDVRPEKK